MFLALTVALLQFTEAAVLADLSAVLVELYLTELTLSRWWWWCTDSTDWRDGSVRSSAWTRRPTD